MTTSHDSNPPQLAVGVTSSRITQVSPAARMVHRAILRSFASTGRAPGVADLAAAIAVGSDIAVLLAELHDHDVVRLDEQGRIRAAYPFSAVPTPHVVRIDGGPTVWSMCAIDALGIADMLGRPVTITSADPSSYLKITVAVRSGQATWQPDTTVVVVGSDTTTAPTGGDCCPPDMTATAAAADRCCGVMNFFTDPASAQRWLAARPQVSAVVLTKQQALHLGIDIFGHLLDDGPDATTTGDPP